MTLDEAVMVARQVMEDLVKYNQPDIEFRLLAQAQMKLNEFQLHARNAEREFMDETDG